MRTVFVLICHLIKNSCVTSIREWNFQNKIGNIPTTPISSPMKDIRNISTLTCGTLCMSDGLCQSFAYDQNEQRCSLYNATKPAVMTSQFDNLYVDRCPLSIGFTYVASIDLCYWFPSVSMTWYQVNTTCYGKGATLVKVDTTQKRDFYKTLTGPSQNLWTGANDLQTEGTFLWPDGNILQNNNVLWDRNWGQPDNYLTNDNCAEIRSDLGYFLHDTDCSYSSFFACQYDV